MKRILIIALILILVLAAVGAVAARTAPVTHHWYLLQGHQGFVICPTELEIEVLAPNAVRLKCNTQERQ